MYKWNQNKSQLKASSEYGLYPTSHPYAFHLFVVIKLEHITEKKNKVTAMLSEQFVLYPVFQTAVYEKTTAFFLPNEMLTSLNDLHRVYQNASIPKTKLPTR